MTIYRGMSRYGAIVGDYNAKGELVVNKQKQAPAKSKEKALKEANLKLEIYENIFALAKEKFGVDLKNFVCVCNKS